MFLALFLLAGAAHLVPARWNSSDPRSLELLANTRINCILLEQQQWDASLIKRAAERHIITLGVIHPDQNLAEYGRRASQLKLSGVVLEGDYEPALSDRLRAAVNSSKIPVIELPTRGRIRLDGHDPIAGTWQGLWPGIEIEHGGKVSTGPTSAPWINTNTGFLRFLRAATDAAVWLGERPPAKTVIPAERYAVAVADAAVAGARWIIALDENFEKRLVGREHDALRAWQQINTYIRYFEDKPEWRSYRPYSELALIEDANSGGLLSSGLLDMLSVMHTAARAVPTRTLSANKLEGARVVLNVDAAAIDARQQQELQKFAASGGKVVNPPGGWRFPATAPDQTVPNRRQVDLMQPIWEPTYNATARKNFGIRTFNTSSVIFHLLAAPDGKGLLIHLLNYADLPAEDVTVYVLGSWKNARLYRPEGPVQQLPVYPVKDGTGVDIAKISVLATLLLD